MTGRFPSRFPDRRNRGGTVLLITMVVVALAAMMSAALLFRSRGELCASRATRRGEQAHAAAVSGINRAIAVVLNCPAGGRTWYDNPALFKNQLVFDDANETWCFSIYAPGDDGQVRYGLIDEAGKININFADAQTLQALGGMNGELIDCLLDWRDGDSEPRSHGAEREYYSSLQPTAYHVRNGPLLTLDELMFVKGFDASVIYGEDANLNGVLDANENDAAECFPPDDGDGRLSRGLDALATTMSYELDVDNEGQARFNINGATEDLTALGELPLSAETVEFIRLYRLEGGKFSHPADLLGMEYTLKQDHEGFSQGKKGRVISSAIGPEQLPVVLDKLTVLTGGKKRPVFALVNVNTAPAEVLAALPQIDENLARWIVAGRDTIEPEAAATPAWLLSAGVVDAEQFRKIIPALTARSFQFRVRVVGFAAPGGQFRVLEAVIDLARGRVRIRYLRDITRLGLPMAIRPEAELSGIEINE